MATCGVREWNAVVCVDRSSKFDPWGPDLEYVENKVVAPMVPPIGRILIIPMPIVDGNLGLRCIAIVHAVAAAIVLAPVEILWIVNVRIVIET